VERSERRGCQDRSPSRFRRTRGRRSGAQSERRRSGIGADENEMIAHPCFPRGWPTRGKHGSQRESFWRARSAVVRARGSSSSNAVYGPDPPPNGIARDPGHGAGPSRRRQAPAAARALILAVRRPCSRGRETARWSDFLFAVRPYLWLTSLVGGGKLSWLGDRGRPVSTADGQTMLGTGSTAQDAIPGDVNRPDSSRLGVSSEATPATGALELGDDTG